MVCHWPHKPTTRQNFHEPYYTDTFHAKRPIRHALRSHGLTFTNHSVPLTAPLVVPFVANPLLDTPPLPKVSLIFVAIGATDARGVPTLEAAAVDWPSCRA